MPTAEDAAAVRWALESGEDGVQDPPQGGRPGGSGKWYHPSTGLLHRLSGPAAQNSAGADLWFVNGRLHRTEGPAEVGSDYGQWWAYDEVHRIDGPALEYRTGSRTWVVSGQDVVRTDEDRLALDRLYDSGDSAHLSQLEQVLTLWRPDGPPVTELCAAVAAASL